MNIICIGGPLDREAVSGEWTPQRTFAVDADAHPKFRYDVYTLRSITGPNGAVIYYFTAEGISDHGAIVRVFTEYARKKG